MDPQASLAADDFTLFDLPRRFTLDPAALDAKWKALQGAAHPDRHASDTPAARRLAMQWAVRINEAHRRLRDPLARAAYLCELSGHDVAAESNTAMPPEFLLQQMAWREALAEAADTAEIEALGAQVARARHGLHAELESAIDQADLVDWPTVAGRVRRLMFIDRFLSDVDRKLD
ncbi:MAG TPA: Fe-S protein assembly co-chaperone HscB [Burkholderiaceae bacterium]|nr:Fe-S protein assembly co-chaperone HscB [Burkholderiaceae bacterium]